jgi:hypothetical protein
MGRTNVGSTAAGARAHVAEFLRNSESSVSERPPYAAVPEPNSLALWMLTFIGLFAVARNCRAAKNVAEIGRRMC